jgi:hypothetical protein
LRFQEVNIVIIAGIEVTGINDLKPWGNLKTIPDCVLPSWSGRNIGIRLSIFGERESTLSWLMEV